MTEIKKPHKMQLLYYGIFAILGFGLLWFYLSATLIHYTTSHQFPINSFERMPLSLLIFPAEAFAIIFGLYFVYTLYGDRNRNAMPKALPDKNNTTIAVLIPVYHEPKYIVERTIRHCQKIKWRGKVNIYVLDDSKEKTAMKEMDDLAKSYKCNIIRRQSREGYKAGNINNALKHVIKEGYFVIFDSDQAPEPDFLVETMDYFSDPAVGFVQTPQYFIINDTPLERAVQMGTNIFFHGQCVSKANDGALPFCGTNAVIRTIAFNEVNGFAYYTATEDIELGIRMNDAGYRGVFIPKILVYGYAPQDFSAFTTQQYRWANGNLAILRQSWLKLLTSNLSFRYQVHTFFTLGWWLIGFVTFLFVLVPILSLSFGLATHHAWLPTFILFALYINVFLGIGMIYVSLKNRTDDKIRISDAFLTYSLITNSMFIYMKAAFNALIGNFVGFVRTDKKGSTSRWTAIRWNLVLATVCFALSVYALFESARAPDFTYFRTYFPISIWLLFYSFVLFSAIIFIGKVQPKEVAA